jgi:hypothetical protein
MAPPKQLRIRKVIDRSGAALKFLVNNGASFLTEISEGIGHSLQRTRYALSTLRQDEKAHIEEFVHVVGVDGVGRMVALFRAGPGVDAFLATPSKPEWVELDFESTQHLQQTYVNWTRTRTPDYVWDDEE